MLALVRIAQVLAILEIRSICLSDRSRNRGCECYSESN